jgi:hypothetical protein
LFRVMLWGNVEPCVDDFSSASPPMRLPDGSRRGTERATLRRATMSPQPKTSSPCASILGSDRDSCRHLVHLLMQVLVQARIERGPKHSPEREHHASQCNRQNTVEQLLPRQEPYSQSDAKDRDKHGPYIRSPNEPPGPDIRDGERNSAAERGTTLASASGTLKSTTKRAPEGHGPGREPTSRRHPRLPCPAAPITEPVTLPIDRALNLPLVLYRTVARARADLTRRAVAWESKGVIQSPP